jgi:predicted RNA-binding protein (virulence factor B family)
MIPRTFEENVTLMKQHVSATIRRLKKDGIIAMSSENLRQCTPTSNITVPVSAFPLLWEEATRDNPFIQNGGVR